MEMLSFEHSEYQVTAIPMETPTSLPGTGLQVTSMAFDEQAVQEADALGRSIVASTETSPEGMRQLGPGYISFMPLTKGQAHSEADWHHAKSILHQLYITEGKTLQNVMHTSMSST